VIHALLDLVYLLCIESILIISHGCKRKQATKVFKSQAILIFPYSQTENYDRFWHGPFIRPDVSVESIYNYLLCNQAGNCERFSWSLLVLANAWANKPYRKPLTILEDPCNSDGFYQKPFHNCKRSMQSRKNIVGIPKPNVI